MLTVRFWTTPISAMILLQDNCNQSGESGKHSEKGMKANIIRKLTGCSTMGLALTSDRASTWFYSPPEEPFSPGQTPNPRPGHVAPVMMLLHEGRYHVDCLDLAPAAVSLERFPHKQPLRHHPPLGYRYLRNCMLNHHQRARHSIELLI